jgi:hypothetical protein
MTYTNPIRAGLAAFRYTGDRECSSVIRQISRCGRDGRRENEAIYQKREMDGVIYRLVKTSDLSLPE